MRPESRWNRNSKDPNDKGKKPSRPRSQRNAARKGKKGDTSKSDAPTEPASSPQDEGSDGAQLSEAEESNERADSQKDNEKSTEDRDEPTLPPIVPPTRTGTENSPRSRSAENMKVTVRRAVKSSPIRPPGSDINGPIEIDLTPKPLRRQLFSSPTNPPNPRQDSDRSVLTEISSNIVRRSPRLNKTRNVDGFLAKIPSPAGKIQSRLKTPWRQQQPADSLEDLFNASDHDENDCAVVPQTPTPTRRSNRLLSRTPSKTPSNPKATNVTLTPSQKHLLDMLRTPKGQVQLSQHPAAAALLGQVTENVADMTPFTRQIHEILTDNPALPSSSPARAKKARDNRSDTLALDFLDLPSLQGSSPNHDKGMQVDFSEFTHLNSDGVESGDPMSGVDLNELLSTDVPMPSSPPLTMGGLIDWGDLMDAGPMGQPQGQKRVSPRRKHGYGLIEGLDSGVVMSDEGQVGMDMGDTDFQRLVDQAFSGRR